VRFIVFVVNVFVTLVLSVRFL